MFKHFITISFCLLIISASAQVSPTRGYASFYANKFDGKTTASGEKYRHDHLTAAHRTLPFGTLVKVTNLANKKSVVVRINDRGPFTEERIIDVSKSAAEILDFISQGLTEVEIEVVSEEKSILNTQSIPTPSNTPQESKVSQPASVKDVKPDPAITNSGASLPQISSSYYKLSSSRFSPIGFGVQIASYQETSNLLEKAAAVEQQLRQPVTVQVVNSNGNRVYRLIVGQFETRAQAEYFKDSIKASYPGFVVNF